jgi:hypothetical protein
MASSSTASLQIVAVLPPPGAIRNVPEGRVWRERWLELATRGFDATMVRRSW